MCLRSMETNTVSCLTHSRTSSLSQRGDRPTDRMAGTSRGTNGRMLIPSDLHVLPAASMT